MKKFTNLRTTATRAAAQDTAEAGYHAKASVKKPTKLDLKLAQAREEVRMAYYEENRLIRADYQTQQRRLSEAIAETGILKSHINDQQMIINILLNELKRINPPKMINTFQDGVEKS